MKSKRKMRSYELDFSKCVTVGDLYQEIRSKLELPEKFGRNLNALWDAVTGMMYTPAQITVIRKVKSAELAEDVCRIISVLFEAAEKYGKITVFVKSDDE